MASDQPPPSVVLNGCTVIGKIQPVTKGYPKAVDLFYGIPFATADRFKCAVAVRPEPGTTIQAGVPSASLPWPFASGEQAESPLRLNVFRPSGTARKTGAGGEASSGDGESQREGGGLPVLVYIHGGAFNFSDPLERDMASFISWGGKDMVVVSIAYRLSALGFLAGDDEVEAPNLGLRDQRLGVEWVREWVGAFGGDGGDLTVMGVSAGAHSIGHHILHPTPLPFSKAVLESGSATARSILSATHPRTLSNLTSLRSHAESPIGTSLAAMPLVDFVEAETMVWADNAESVCWPFQPVIDGVGGMVPDAPLKLWDEAVEGGRLKGKAVITGFCSHEGTNFVPQRASTNAEFLSFFKTLIPSLSSSDLKALETLYPDPVTNPSSPYTENHPGRGAQFKRLHSAYAHYAYICPIIHTAHRLSLAGSKVYLYEFAALSSTFHAASHGDQADVVAHDMRALRGKPGLAEVAREMNSRWTAFAADKEGRLGEEVWPAFVSPFAEDAEGKGEMLVFGEGNDEDDGGRGRGVAVGRRSLTEREREQCAFWWERMELSQGLGRRSS